MICDNCKKKEATVHLTEIVNDKVTKMHLCEDCAKSKSDEMEAHFGINDLLAGLADFGVPQDAKGKKALKCGACGFTFAEFQKIGRLGCPKCYDSFQAQISPLLKKIHGSDSHTGKMLVKATKGKVGKEMSELQDMKIRLQKAVLSEAFEEAAALRDKIRKLESKIIEEGEVEDR